MGAVGPFGEDPKRDLDVGSYSHVPRGSKRVLRTEGFVLGSSLKERQG